MKLLVISSINMDMILRMPRVPEAGESLLADEYGYAGGGKGANSAVAAARAGAESILCACLGDDANGAVLYENIKSEGIDVSHLHLLKDAPTGLAVIMLEDNGQNRIAVYAGANLRLAPDIAAKALDGDYDALLMQFEIPEETVISSVKAAAAQGKTVVIDAGPARGFPIEKLEGVTILSPNETETEALSGIYPADDESCLAAARALMGRCPSKYIVLKLGGRGAYLYDGTCGRRFPAFPIKPVDTTAAGDAFTAALTAEYVRTGDIERALIFANAAGALTATRIGAQPSLPHENEIRGFIEKNTLQGKAGA